MPITRCLNCVFWSSGKLVKSYGHCYKLHVNRFNVDFCDKGAPRPVCFGLQDDFNIPCAEKGVSCPHKCQHECWRETAKLLNKVSING